MLLLLLQLREGFVMAPFFRRQVRGHLDFDRGIQVAAFLTVADLRHAVSLQAEYLPVLCSWWNLQAQRTAVERRDLGFSSKHSRGNRYRDLRVKVHATSLER